MIHENEFLCLGRKIAELRENEGMTQKHLAKKVGISASYLGKVECGRSVSGVSLEILYQISEGLKVKPDQLLRYSKDDLRRVERFKMRRKVRDLQKAKAALKVAEN